MLVFFCKGSTCLQIAHDFCRSPKDVLSFYYVSWRMCINFRGWSVQLEIQLMLMSCQFPILSQFSPSHNQPHGISLLPLQTIFLLHTDAHAVHQASKHFQDKVLLHWCNSEDALPPPILPMIEVQGACVEVNRIQLVVTIRVLWHQTLRAFYWQLSQGSVGWLLERHPQIPSVPRF